MWAAILAWLPRIMLIVMGALGAYFMWQWGSAITQGVQQAAPGLGAAVGAVGMLFALLPIFFMFMMFAMMFTMFATMLRV